MPSPLLSSTTRQRQDLNPMARAALQAAAEDQTAGHGVGDGQVAEAVQDSSMCMIVSRLQQFAASRAEWRSFASTYAPPCPPKRSPADSLAQTSQRPPSATG